MAEQLEARIIVKKLRDGKAELSFVDPKSGRLCNTGLKVGPGQETIDQHIYQMKRNFERAGHRVTVKEM